MRRAGLQGVPQRRRWRKKLAEAHPHGTRNNLERDFTATAPNTRWVTDITSIRTAEQWWYLCVVLDLYSGLVVGWSMSPRQDRQLVFQAVLMALWQRPARTPVILHSDRGCQFNSEEYQRFLDAYQVICSMSAMGSCADNAVPKASSAWSNVNARIASTIGQEPKRGPISFTISNGVIIRASDGDWNCTNARSNSLLNRP